MSLLSLTLNQFRNMASLSLTAHPFFNIIYGENGSGKTSLLEGIYYLAHGRSFRTSRYQRLIQHDTEQFTLHSKVSLADNQTINLGLQRNKQGDLLLRLNATTINRLADFARVLPVQLITPDSFKLFFGGPKERRQFFDMGLFHVEPAFFDVWLRFNKVLKQRNALLKTTAKYNSEFEYWDQQFVALSLELQQLRQQYIDQLQQAFREIWQLEYESKESKISFQLQSGWPDKADSAEQWLALLQHNFLSDHKMGHTQYGPQKADLKIRKGQHAAEEVLSRGQLKVLLFALKIAQNNVIKQYGKKQPILLIDDLTSELDTTSLQHIFEFLNNSHSQVFITTIYAGQVQPYIAADKMQMFHVEHGQLLV